MHEDARIFNIANGGSTEVLTFDEAIDGYSNANGKGRAKRVAKKQLKKANKQAKKMTRIGNKQERKSTRKTNRQGNKQQKVEAKIGRKQTKVEGRQTKRDTRFQGRQNRKPEPVESQDEQLQSSEDENVNSAPADTQDQAQEPAFQESQYEEEAMDQPASQVDEDLEEGQFSDYDEDQESGTDESEEEGESFDGDEGDSCFSAERHAHIPDTIMEGARKVIWNDAKAHKAKRQLTSGADGIDTSQLEAQISHFEGRRNAFSKMLEGYSNARGPKAKAQVKQAMQVARQEMKKAIQAPAAKKAAAPIARPSAPKRAAAPVFRREIKPMRPAPKPAPIPVSPALDPKFEKDEIVIPEEGSEEEYEEGDSNFDGTEYINWNSIAGGVGIGVGIFLLLKVTKVI